MATALLKSAAFTMTGYTGGIISGIRKSYTRRVPIEFERGDFIVKTACSRREFWQVMKLRYDVFHKEYKNKKFPFGLDKDRYDRLADHLIIIDKKINKVVGTYRLLSSTITQEFYSQTEFELSDFLKTPEIKVELSRACINKEYRNGVVMSLLWRGLTKYIQETKAKYLFGLASVKTTDPQIALQLMNYFEEKGNTSNEFQVSVVSEFAISELKDDNKRSMEAKLVESLIPTLVKSYLRAGAKIFGQPAIDVDFNCTDYFMILDMSELTQLYEKRYQLN